MHTRLLSAAAARAADQFGVVAVSQLAALGVDRSAVARAHRAGVLHRVHPGVYAVGHPVLTREGRWMAAQLWAGVDDGLLGHWTAACASGLRVDPPPGTHVIVPPTHSARNTRLVVHRSRVREEDRVTQGPLRLTSWPRTIVDCADIATERQVRALVDRALQLGVYDHPVMVRAAEAAHGRRGRRRLDRVLAALADTPEVYRSWTERVVADELVRRGLPQPEVNATLRRPDGSYDEVDLSWRRARLIVELDGPQHESPFQRAADEARDARLRASGWDVRRYPLRGFDVMRLAADVVVALAAV